MRWYGSKIAGTEYQKSLFNVYVCVWWPEIILIFLVFRIAWKEREWWSTANFELTHLYATSWVLLLCLSLLLSIWRLSFCLCVLVISRAQVVRSAPYNQGWPFHQQRMFQDLVGKGNNARTGPRWRAQFDVNLLLSGSQWIPQWKLIQG